MQADLVFEQFKIIIFYFKRKNANIVVVIVELGNIEELLNEHEMVFLIDQAADKNLQQVIFSYIHSYLVSNIEYVKTRINYFMNHVDKVCKINSSTRQLLERTKNDIEFSKWVSYWKIFNNENTRRVKV